MLEHAGGISVAIRYLGIPPALSPPLPPSLTTTPIHPLPGPFPPKTPPPYPLITLLFRYSVFTFSLPYYSSFLFIMSSFIYVSLHMSLFLVFFPCLYFLDFCFFADLSFSVFLPLFSLFLYIFLLYLSLYFFSLFHIYLSLFFLSSPIFIYWSLSISCLYFLAFSPFTSFFLVFSSFTWL